MGRTLVGLVLGPRPSRLRLRAYHSVVPRLSETIPLLAVRDLPRAVVFYA